MQRGDVWWVNFDPSMGGEIQKIRPAVIVSNNAFNDIMNRVQVVPLTSNIERCYPCEACVEIEGRKSKAMADQLVTVSKLRFKTKIGRVSAQHLEDIEGAIKVQFGL
ncbi:MAG: type II toxin-antitoxin system PemK/MazF family toxin [Gammaproteobacteria bacterium]|nr:type II toxin-antitoxin system PemK/MazF family toxin [Gammaproteobacteria bacterium]